MNRHMFLANFSLLGSIIMLFRDKANLNALIVETKTESTSITWYQGSTNWANITSLAAFFT